MKKYIKGYFLLSCNNVALLLFVSGILTKNVQMSGLIFYGVLWFVTFMLIWVAVGMGIERIKNEVIQDESMKKDN